MKHTLYQTKSNPTETISTSELDFAEKDAAKYYMQFMTEEEQEEFLSTLV